MRTLVTIVIASVVLVAGLALPADGRAGPVATCDGQPATIVGAGVINGTAGSDVIVGSSGIDKIKGNGGNDIICGGDGADVIHGNSGNDRIFGEKDADQLFGDAGDDHLDLGHDVLTLGIPAVAKGGTGNDNLTSLDVGFYWQGGRYYGFAVLEGGAGDDTIEAESGNFFGGSGNDHLIGGYGMLEGGAGDDILSSSAQYVTLNGGSGDDHLTAFGPDLYFIAGSGRDICDEGTTPNFLISCEQVI